MCGIAGYFGKAELNPLQIYRTLDLMKNRGPDHSAALNIDAGERQLSFLHSRLAIIDLDPRSNQPFKIDHCTLIFNGEIYNYLELRKSLEQKGISFRTSSDTEVLLQSYLLYGEDCVKDFEGMWSFAIYDANKRALLLSRDRFGEKPLYYLQNASGLYFGSEVKFLKGLTGESLAVNEQQILRYLVNGYKALYKHGETFYRDVKEIPSASTVTIGSDGKLQTRRFWSPGYAPKKMSADDAIQGIRHHLSESVKIRLRADVPLAFCLSGGIDSGALVSIAAKQFNCDVASFSIIDSDERYNEYDNISATIKDVGCKNTVIEIPQERSFNKLRELISYHDSPIATITYYIHSFLSEAIANAGFKVVFSGTASDELFTGYYDHFHLHLYEVKDHPQFKKYLSDWQEHIASITRNPLLKDPNRILNNPHDHEHIYLNSDEFASYLKRDFHESFIQQEYTLAPLRNRMLNELFYEVTPVVLHEDDLNSMKYSLENRSPFLDSRLFEFAFSIPSEHLIQNGYGKYLLREAMQGILNDKVRLDRQKKGFNASINSVFDFANPAVRDDLLGESPVYDLVKRESIKALIESGDSLPNSFSKFLFNFINTKLFLESQAV